MEKLIELLNEYEMETKNSEYSEWWDLLGGRPQYLRCDTVESELLIISKGYRFIKWLVENEKIDVEKAKILKSGHTAELMDYLDFIDGTMDVRDYSYFDDDEQVLMLLSIQDEPISFLISILK